MSMRHRPKEEQPEFWIATGDLARTAGQPFSDSLSGVLADAGFDEPTSHPKPFFNGLLAAGRGAVPRSG